MAIDASFALPKSTAGSADSWDFPTVSLNNFMKNSPQKIGISAAPFSMSLTFSEAFLSFSSTLTFLEEGDHLGSLLLKISALQLISDRQQKEFSSPESRREQAWRFLNFLVASDAPSLLAVVICFFGSDPIGRSCLHEDEPRVWELLRSSNVVSSEGIPYQDAQAHDPTGVCEPYPTATPPLSPGSRPGFPGDLCLLQKPGCLSPSAHTQERCGILHLSASEPYLGFSEDLSHWKQLEQPWLSPTPGQAFYVATPPSSPRLFQEYSEDTSVKNVGSPSISLNTQDTNFTIDSPFSPGYRQRTQSDLPASQSSVHGTYEEADQNSKFPPQVIEDIERSGARVILTHTDRQYRGHASRCFLAFSVVFQALETRFKKAKISMNFLPDETTLQKPIILNIFPNSTQEWPTGPSWDLVSAATKALSFTVVGAPSPMVNLNTKAAWEKTKIIQSASFSSLTAAGIGTSKLTVVLKESQAGDGIIYSFPFAVVVDLKGYEKPTFEINLRLQCLLGHRPWY
ncbi:hypothetical protein O181_029791 [Austropuccinia psidii MF-1]|uniref:Uncharacterized protein n=1 Tax=Austropuccinia psidii MF-1 TaxID=1389203 RepID=A0A9Q3H3M3_9BASI|nr:hypothetical protein [Austropuccinia psidii MF-1]